MRTCSVWLTLPLLLAASTAAGEGLKLATGEWKVTTTTEHSMMPKPETKTSTECVKQATWDPTKEMVKDSKCSVTDQTVDGNTMRWKLNCPNQVGSMTGSGEFTSDGDSAHGTMQMSASVQGRPMTFKVTWKGSRVGDCS